MSLWFSVEWVIRKAFFAELAVEGWHVPFSVDLPAVDDPLGQVGIRDVQFSEANGVAMPSSDLFQSCLLVKGVVSDQ